MKSVDKLRNWADGLRDIWIDPNDHSIIVTTCDDMPPSIDCVNLREHVNAILDNIDREEADMVPLPVDTDGVPIHVGDVMEFTYDPPQDQPLFEVSGFGADETLFYAARGEVIPRKVTKASVVRHHHAQTVEDVLEEFVARWMETHHDDIPALKAEYAAKLRLAGEGE